MSLIQFWLHFHILHVEKVNNRLLIRVLEILVLCLNWELLVGSQWVYCMAVFVLGNFYNTRVYCLSEVSYNNMWYVIARNLYPFIAYITAYSIMIICKKFFTNVTWKFHINISKMINRMSLLIDEMILLKLQPNRDLYLLVWLILLSILTVTNKIRNISYNN